MFMRMEPQDAFSSFKVLVPVPSSMQRMEQSWWRRKTVEMPGNDTSDWEAHKPTVYTASNTCDFQENSFGSDDNIATKGLYSRKSCTIQNPIKQYPSNLEYTLSHQAYHSQSSNEANFFPPLPVSRYLGSSVNLNQSQECLDSSEHEDISVYKEPQSLIQDSFSCSASLTPKEQEQSVYAEEHWQINHGLDFESSSPSPVYDSSSTLMASLDHQILGMENFDMNGISGFEPRKFWPGFVPEADAFDNVYNGEVYIDYHQYGDRQQKGRCTQEAHWPSQLIPSATLSPELLDPRVRSVSSASPSKSGSTHRFADWPERNAISSTADEISDSASESLIGMKTDQRSKRPRRLLPDTTRESNKHLSRPTRNDLLVDRSSRKCYTNQSGYQNRNEGSPILAKTLVAKYRSARRKEISIRTSSARRKFESNESIPSTEESSAAACATHTRTCTAKDDFLVRNKQAGMSYKEIKRKGGYTEAESTLRGRFRTLTKEKSARVRKPEWSENDIRLLEKGVKKLTPQGDRCKIPWKLVAEYIANHGGSYHFGNATCRKRWDELRKDSSFSARTK